MKKKILRINDLLLKKFGKPKKAATPPKPIDLLIATILSQNTNDNNSFKAYQNLKKRFPNWETIAKARLSTIEKEIKPAGLNKQKAKAIKNLITSIIDGKGRLKLEFDNKSDSDIIERLTSFKGIGVKTASCVLLFSLERDVCPVDTHVHRTLNRIGVVKTNSRDKTYFILNENFPEGVAHSFHTNLIRLGRAVCKPKNPRCSQCPLLKECEWEDKNTEENSAEIKRRDFMLLDNVN